MLLAQTDVRKQPTHRLRCLRTLVLRLLHAIPHDRRSRQVVLSALRGTDDAPTTAAATGSSSTTCDAPTVTASRVQRLPTPFHR